MKKRIIITNKKRFITFICMCLALITAFCFMLFTKHASVAFAQQNMATVYVQPGDTLWSIAKEYKAEKADIRDVIDDIMEYNHLQSAVIYTGDKLIIPN